MNWNQVFFICQRPPSVFFSKKIRTGISPSGFHFFMLLLYHNKKGIKRLFRAFLGLFFILQHF
nr:MAG TPA: hypothetical protein [Caudoviricetes sp.]